MKKQTQTEFINKSKKIFGNKLDYSKVNYVNSRIEIILICKEHGEFLIKPKDHLAYKRECKFCQTKYNSEALDF